MLLGDSYELFCTLTFWEYKRKWWFNQYAHAYMHNLHMPFNDLKLCFIAFVLFLTMMTLVFIIGLRYIYSFVIRCLFYPWPLTPYCCGGVRFISASSLFIFLSWGACFIFGPWHCIPVVTLVLFLVSNLFILLSWDVCFIYGIWHHVAVMTLVLSLVSRLFSLLSWGVCFILDPWH